MTRFHPFAHPFARAALLAFAAFCGFLLVGAISPGTWLLDTLTGLFAAGLLVMSLHLLIGYTGLISFGHAAYYASGGYIFGMVLQTPAFVAACGAWSVPLATLLAFCGTGLFALVVGSICARLSEIYFAFLTLAFQMLFVSIIQGLVHYTGGDQGLMGGIPRPAFLGLDLVQARDRYAFSAFLFVAGVLAVRLITLSSFGASLRMVRDNERRAAFLGVNTYLVKVLAFTAAGSIASLGGVVLAVFTSAAYPEWASWSVSGEAIFMIMLGGLHSFWGPLVGVVAMRIINDLTLLYTTHTEMAKGLAILFVVLVLKRGILDWLADWRKARHAAPSAKEQDHAAP
ncbi:branched-chain amino acid transport system permease protein [Aquamicrobium lusatiense]|uniref:Branched-chain amino acid transport system permease protein n=1 Tax=Aquamicrobium lusatiense TaxID=89772 RepID=A0A7W9S6D2_9HYPH|nr:branched-chain amino acid ABC transporter permease [Aquamicrobium lusatiense]MBB6013838.1 branched-chain amino acid transport system permease protein [Aquamicrobium lusatiense]